jgi:KUP system potassium uptake protein
MGHWLFTEISEQVLYLKECFPLARLPINHDNILGVLSLIFWSLIIVVTIKYHLLIIRLDNEGEGGIMALMELVRPKVRIGLVI